MSESITQNRAKHPITYRGDQVPRWRVLELSLSSPRSFSTPVQEARITAGGHGVWGWDDGSDAPADHPNTGIPLPWRQALTMPAAEQIAHLADAFTSIEWWTLRPAPHLLLEQPGKEDIRKHILVSAAATHLIVAYIPAGGEIRLDAAAIGDSHAATWFNPRSGERQRADGQTIGKAKVFSTPDDEDWLLILQSPK